MSLPPLHRLRLQTHPTSTQQDDRDKGEVYESVRKLASRATYNVVHDVANAPSILCLKDTDSRSLEAAHVTLEFLKTHSSDPYHAQNQYDNKADHERHLKKLQEGLNPPVVTQFKEVLFHDSKFMHIIGRVRLRLHSIVEQLKEDLRARAWIGTRAGLGWVTSLLSHYGTEKNEYRFHQDMPEAGKRSLLPPGTKNWLMMTMVYYLLDEDDEEDAKKRVGQGSTLYNLNGGHESNPDTQVAFCPLSNGSITIFDGTRWHAVGPNHGITRGAIIYKIVLYRDDTPEREWSREEWWKRARDSIKEMAGDPRNMFEYQSNETSALYSAIDSHKKGAV